MPLTETGFEFEGLRVHGWEGGSGYPVLMLHGSGPGASTLGNWRLVLDRMASRYRVLALDLIGFGKSDRRASAPYFDMELWVRQAAAGLDRLGASSVGILGHSLSGAIALRLAARDDRVRRVMTTGTMGTAMPANPLLDLVWTCPASREEMRRAAECLVHDKGHVTEAYLDNRMSVIGDPEYRSYFNAMFAGPKERFIARSTLSPAELAAVRADVVMVHGRNDAPFPLEQTTDVLARSLPDATVLALPRCGHSVALENPDALMAAAGLAFG